MKQLLSILTVLFTVIIFSGFSFAQDASFELIQIELKK